MLEPTQNILIVGATSDIGDSIARELSSPKTTIYATGRNVSKLTILKKYLVNLNNECHIHTLDINDINEVLALHDEVSNTSIKFDWIIYCVGYIDKSEPYLLSKSSSVQRTFNTNVLSAIELIRILEDKIKNNGGVIFISSTAGIWGNADYPMYSSSKSALNNFSKSLAKRWQSKKNSISLCPGPTNTKMREEIAGDAQNYQDPDVISKVIKTITSGKSKYKSGDVVIVRDGATSILRE